MFVIDYRTLRDIFWSVTILTLKTNIAIPDILNEETDMDQLFDDIYSNLDPFYKTLYGAFEDPSGQ
jgi:hypothetical protein